MRPYHPDTLSDFWRELCGAAKVRQIRLHDARDSCASIMHAQAVLIAVISAWVGHADPAFTMRTYVHAQNDALKAAADTLEKVVTRSRRRWSRWRWPELGAGAECRCRAFMTPTCFVVARGRPTHEPRRHCRRLVSLPACLVCKDFPPSGPARCQPGAAIRQPVDDVRSSSWRSCSCSYDVWNIQEVHPGVVVQIHQKYNATSAKAALP
ncbi:MAG TPA: tyrosine-type recombinase/integrase [Mycobacterium sp.]|nr:tyrosine-type recombinase/integrase [Mycobacterium sp.]